MCPFPAVRAGGRPSSATQRFLDELASRTDLRRVLLIGHVATRWALDQALGGVPLERLARMPFAWQEGWEYVLDEKMG